jgi:glycerol kinase
VRLCAAGISSNFKLDKAFKPNMEVQKREKLYKGWKKAVKRTKNWEE